MNLHRVALVAIALSFATTIVAATDVAASAQTESCRGAYCVEDEITIPGAGPSEPEPPAGQPIPVRNQPPAATPQCAWVRDPGPLLGGDGGPGAFPDVGVQPTDGSYLVFEQCDEALTGRVRWVTPTEPAPGPGPVAQPQVTPAQLAQVIRVRLEGTLPEPVVTTSPPTGEPAVVNHPAFLAIENWLGPFTDEECSGILCVTVEATPALTWSPGEPGSLPLTCTGAGTTFDPAGALPHTQASQPGSCAYTYASRTNVEGRPAQWPGTAAVTWRLTWTSTSGIDGVLDPIVRSTDVPRAVDEVQAIVVSH